MTKDPWAPLAALHAQLPRGRLDRYVDELERWNRTIRLVGPRDRAGIRLQVIDAVLPFLHLPPRFPLLDIGSGAGLPGIPLALLHPQGTILCMEPRIKRVAFLRHACRVLALNNVQVIAERTSGALLADPSLAHCVLTATARAVADVPSLLEAAAPFLAPEGRVVLPRGGEDKSPPPPGWERSRCLPYVAPKPLGSRSVQEFLRS
ncbi:MAG TPA: 16S rRNA (guanine(527)-N(7))-methyltransferase RsmG [Deferrisomatales bacterium]|nr:16S rRNA (guanine(527)-N(7))-methyltransferase RsmG [Deferrisomatales bacterium]